MASRDEVDYDVLLVGFGPVGQTLSILLAQHGHRVGAVERWPQPYARPRAVHYDDEIARVFAAAGVSAEVAAISEPSGEYDWQNAAGQTLLHFDWSVPGPSGWPTANMFSQPELEAVLSTRAASFPNVQVRRGEEAVHLVDHADHVEIAVRGPVAEHRTIRARYVVGCDGANSFVRERMGTAINDLGFFYDWLILDVIPAQRREWRPFNLQICDPVRPTTVVSGGPGRRRWEFMRLPGETIEELNTEQTAWRLLEPWGLTPANATLERHTVYTFQAQWAQDWRVGRLLIAGDAAHLMPPFAGQGMCSGIRDAANLAWKLDLVLRGVVSDALLDTYTTERAAHVRHAIGMSVELGNVICMSDPAQVAARDEAMLEADGRPEVALPPVPPPVLGPGILHSGPDGSPIGPAGQLSAQARVAVPDGAAGRLDQVIGTGFVVAATSDIAGTLSARQIQWLHRLGARLIRFIAPGQRERSAPLIQDVIDVDHFYLPHLAAAGHEAVIVRPDFYLFGAAASRDHATALVGDLLAKLAVREPTASASRGNDA